LIKDPKFDKNKLYFIPLGGAGHFGANLNIYVFQSKILIVDFGIGFPNKSKDPNIDAYLPDIDFLKRHKEDIVGMVITHAHEDHVGAIPYLWQHLKCPIYATAFSAEFIRTKTRQKAWYKDLNLKEVDLSAHLEIGPFSCDLININHSILEPNALTIKVDGYKPLFHTGDWKHDETPVIGEHTDIEAQDFLAEQDILAAIGDSTNALRKGYSRSEKDVQNCLISLFKKRKKRIVVTCFSSNVGRWFSVAKAAELNGRHVALVGRSLWRMYECALYAGYLQDCPKFLNAEKASFLPNDKVVYICTGTQGEENSAMHKIAYQNHRDIELESGDCVVFSSFDIPGNETNITQMKEQLLKRGIEVVDRSDISETHASGHPNQEELRDLYTRLKPTIVIPVHGEVPMLHAHAKIAQSCNVKQTLIPKNGDVIVFENDQAKSIDHIPVNLKIIDHGMITDQNSLYLSNRKKLSVAGTCTISLIIGEKNELIGKPQAVTIGIIDDFENEAEIYNNLEHFLSNNFTAHKKEILIKEDMRRAARRFFSRELNRKKPVTNVILHKVKG